MSFTTFPRGPGPLVTILCPTRGRPEYLAQSIDSLFSLAKNPSCIELLFKIDDDDETTLEVVKHIGSMVPNTQALVSPRGNGFQDIHLWYNQLSSVASGDWLLVWNDDAVMRTEDWDLKLEHTALELRAWHGAMDICCLSVDMEDDPGCTAFFFLRRKVVELLGRFSVIPHCDTWVTKMMRSVDSLVPISHIKVAHLRATDKVFDEGQTARITTQYTTHGHAENLERLHDAIKLQEYICEYGVK